MGQNFQSPHQKFREKSLNTAETARWNYIFICPAKGYDVVFISKSLGEFKTENIDLTVVLKHNIIHQTVDHISCDWWKDKMKLWFDKISKDAGTESCIALPSIMEKKG